MASASIEALKQGMENFEAILKIGVLDGHAFGVIALPRGVSDMPYNLKS